MIDTSKTTFETRIYLLLPSGPKKLGLAIEVADVRACRTTSCSFRWMKTGSRRAGRRLCAGIAWFRWM